jgi:hypothetical protein
MKFLDTPRETSERSRGHVLFPELISNLRTTAAEGKIPDCIAAILASENDDFTIVFKFAILC